MNVLIQIILGTFVAMSVGISTQSPLLSAVSGFVFTLFLGLALRK